MPKPTLVDHPRTGEKVSLGQLAASEGLERVTVARRYKKGKRGMELIETVPERSRTLKASNQRRREQSKAVKEKRQSMAIYAQHLGRARRLGDLGRAREQLV